ncbi:MAG: 3-isopropylmalate dehydrogenase [Acidobacteriota bacterium]
MFKIAVLPGDGIGVEIVPEAVKVLQTVGDKFGHKFEFEEALVGGAAYDATGHPLPEATLALCKASQAVLLGAIGGPKWDNLPTHLRPELGALLPLRKELALYANIRPAYLFEELTDASALKPEVVQGINILVVRELTGGIYFGKKHREKTATGEMAMDENLYTTEEIERIGRWAFNAARKRTKKLISVDKANVLETSRLWRQVMTDIAKDYPDVELSHMLVDNCAMQLIRNPRQFDVIVTDNMFGDILTDEASMLTGSIGMLPSASIGGEVGLYEPSHGSAPDIAGQKKANPLATILSAGMMLEYSFNLSKEAAVIEAAVRKVLSEGYRTPDIYEDGKSLVNTEQMGDLVAQKVREGV